MKTNRLTLIADPIDATHPDRLERPRVPDEAQRARASEAPIGAGMYLLDCECGRRFRSDASWTALCPICEGEAQAERHEPEAVWRAYRSYEYRRIGRGRDRG